MERAELTALIERAVRKEITVPRVVAKLLEDLGRGGRIFVADENLIGLIPELAKLGYTVHGVWLEWLETPDETIKKALCAKVLITRNGKDFADDCKKYHSAWFGSSQNCR